MKSKRVVQSVRPHALDQSKKYDLENLLADTCIHPYPQKYDCFTPSTIATSNIMVKVPNFQ